MKPSIYVYVRIYICIYAIEYSIFLNDGRLVALGMHLLEQSTDPGGDVQNLDSWLLADSPVGLGMSTMPNMGNWASPSEVRLWMI